VEEAKKGKKCPKDKIIREGNAYWCLSSGQPHQFDAAGSMQVAQYR